MSEEEFLKKRFKPFEEMVYKCDRTINIDEQRGIIVPCMLIGIDFEQRLFKLLPFPSELYGFDEDTEFWARCDYCDRPPRKMKMIK